MATEIRRMPVKIERVDLTGDWDGWWFTARTNAPWGVMEDLQGMGTEARFATMREVLAGVLRSPWNFVDEDGEPLEVSAEILRVLPVDLVVEMIGRYTEKLAAVPPRSSAG